MLCAEDKSKWFFALSMWLQTVEQNRTSLLCFFIVCDLVVQHGCVDGRRKKRVSVPGAWNILGLNGRSSECFVQKTNPCVLYFEHVAPDCRTEWNQSFMIFYGQWFSDSAWLCWRTTQEEGFSARCLKYPWTKWKVVRMLCAEDKSMCALLWACGSRLSNRIEPVFYDFLWLLI